MVREAPFRHDASATRYNPAGAVCRERNVWQTHAGVNGKVVNALLGFIVALEQLEELCRDVNVIGSYPRGTP